MFFPLPVNMKKGEKKMKNPPLQLLATMLEIGKIVFRIWLTQPSHSERLKLMARYRSKEKKAAKTWLWLPSLSGRENQ